MALTDQWVLDMIQAETQSPQSLGTSIFGDDPNVFCYKSDDGFVTSKWDADPYTNATLTFRQDNGGDALTINFSTGDIKIAEGLLIDDVANLFWDRVMEMNPLQNIPVPPPTVQYTGGYTPLYSDLPLVEEKTPEETALEAYARAMKVVK